MGVPPHDRRRARTGDEPEGRDTQQAPPQHRPTLRAGHAGTCAAIRPAIGRTPATIRVNLDRVDRLINLIGELVIMEAMLSQAVESAGLASDSDVSNGLDGIKQLASGIQESVMAIRAQPLKPVFQRMHRIIREAADAPGNRFDSSRSERRRRSTKPSSNGLSIR
jgi:chemotaxis protein histidine kinase CheA